MTGFSNSELFTTIEKPQAGDLVIFPAFENLPNHIGFVVDTDRWIGSQSSTGVAYVKFNNPYWARRPKFFRRLKTYSTQSLSSYIKSAGQHYA